jgi:N-acetylmuramoyl-L-alanine amidase
MRVILWWAGTAKATVRAALYVSVSLAIAVAAVPLAPHLWSVAWPVLSVAIDAGHGGIDPGAVGPQGLKEKVVTLDVARRVQALLRAAGEQAFLTRTDDARLDTSQARDLRARVRLANDRQVDILVSIHCNSFRSAAAKGPRTYYQPGSQDGQRLAQCIQDQLRAVVGYGAQEPTPENHLITRESQMTAVIVELAYISNHDEERLLRTPAFRKRLAEAVVQGILDYRDSIPLH